MIKSLFLNADDMLGQPRLSDEFFSDIDDVVTPPTSGLLSQVFEDDVDVPNVDDLDDVRDWASESDADRAVRLNPRKRRWTQISRSGHEAWLHNDCLPHLRRSLNKRGFISIYQLARAQKTLGYDERLCAVLSRELDHDGVRVTRSVAHSSVQSISVTEAEKSFAHLLERPPYPRDVLRYMRMDHLRLSPAVVDFVVSAFEMHRLTHVTEHVLTKRLLAARERGGPAAVRVNAFEAWHALFNDNLYLVCRLASRRVGEGLDIEDLIQEGCLGLMDGLDRYEPGKVPRVMQYVSNWIFQHIMRALADKGHITRLPLYFYNILSHVSAVTEEYASQYGEIPTIRWCATRLELSVETIERAFGFMDGVVSLDEILDEQAALGGSRPVQLLSNDASERVDRLLLQYDMKRLLKNLNSRERSVVELRFGLRDGVERSPEVVGTEIGLHRERVRQIEQQALSKLEVLYRLKDDPHADRRLPVGTWSRSRRRRYRL